MDAKIASSCGAATTAIPTSAPVTLRGRTSTVFYGQPRTLVVTSEHEDRDCYELIAVPEFDLELGEQHIGGSSRESHCTRAAALGLAPRPRASAAVPSQPRIPVHPQVLEEDPEERVLEALGYEDQRKADLQ